jgi:hypothetical protein
MSQLSITWTYSSQINGADEDGGEFDVVVSDLYGYEKAMAVLYMISRS